MRLVQILSIFFFRFIQLNILQHRSLENIPVLFGLENLLDENALYPYLNREMFGRHMSDICRPLVQAHISFLGFHLRGRSIFNIHTLSILQAPET